MSLSSHRATEPALIPYVITQGKVLVTSALYLKRPNFEPRLVGRPSWSHILASGPIFKWWLLRLFLRYFAYCQARANFESKNTFKEIKYCASRFRENELTCWYVIKGGRNHRTYTCHLILIITREQAYIIISSHDNKNTSHLINMFIITSLNVLTSSTLIQKVHQVHTCSSYLSNSSMHALTIVRPPHHPYTKYLRMMNWILWKITYVPQVWT